MSSVKNILDSYLGKNTRVSEKDLGNGSKQVCDLDSGECYTVRMKDGLIERVDNTMNQSKKIQSNLCIFCTAKSNFILSK
jgi:hypothetical protein